MKLYHLKKLRIALSLVFLLAILSLFLGLGPGFLKDIGNVLLRFQLFPSFLYFLALFFSISGLGFLVVLLMTWLFGRVYCSSICPLGTLQDIIIAISRRFKSKKQRRFNYSPRSNRWLRYSILAATLIVWAAGSLVLINLLDPYANFGKIAVSFFHPAAIWLNNTLGFTLQRMDIFAIRPMGMHGLPWSVMLVSAIILMTIVIMSVWRGRLFCNTICPAGSLLGAVSSVSLLRISFQEDACTMCKKCERLCKAQCLDSVTKTVDNSRCISCFNCFSSCPNHGIYYEIRPFWKKSKTPVQTTTNNGQSSGKRQFLLSFAAAMASIPFLGKIARGAQSLGQGPGQGQGQGQGQGRVHGSGVIPYGARKPVSPPGSISHEHFNNHCIACYLCVSACPSKVIVPAFFDYGLKGFMQPRLDFEKSFCNYDCVECSQVCPTGAIKPQVIEDKQVIKIGVARFLMESCVVTVDRTDCGACAEHCPTKAIEMVPYENGLLIPKITPPLCIGCGACEFACPTSPYKAIYVAGMPSHRTAQAVDTSQGPKEDATEDFPF